MKPKAIIFPLAVLLIGFLFTTGETRGLGCLEKRGIECYCCPPGHGATGASETFSPCPCPGCDQAFPLSQEFFTVSSTPDLDLPFQRGILAANPIFLNYTGPKPKKPPPPLFF
jgi:hypothetical protein